MGDLPEKQNAKDPRSIFNYDNYRDYLRDTLSERKQKDRKLSMRQFARMAGFRAHSFVILVLQGKTDLSEESISKISKALKLEKEEAYYFKNLVLLNQAKSIEEKQTQAAKILKSQTYREIHPLREAQYHYLSKWYFVVIREMVSLPDFSENPEWIANKIAPEISPEDAKQAIDEMILLGLLTRSPDGKISQVNSFIASPDEVFASSAAQFHREMMKRASESIDRFPRNKRDLSTLTLSLSKEKASDLKKMIQDFRKSLLEFCARDNNPSTIYQVNLHLFPVIQSDDGQGKDL